MERDIGSRRVAEQRGEFQLTRSRGARLGRSPRSSADRQNFNSRAHVERDEIVVMGVAIGSISTHALTWSATMPDKNYIFQILDFNSRAHVERDCFTFAHFYIFLVISTHALTWSATSTGNTHYEYFKISTHALTWSATCTNKRRSGLSAFQLTRSRGARLEDGIAKKLGVNISTHALTWSATPLGRGR